MQSVATLHITKTDGVCGGRACLAGHRARVVDVVLWHELRGFRPQPKKADKVAAAEPQ